MPLVKTIFSLAFLYSFCTISQNPNFASWCVYRFFMIYSKFQLFPPPQKILTFRSKIVTYSQQYWFSYKHTKFSSKNIERGHPPCAPVKIPRLLWKINERKSKKLLSLVDEIEKAIEQSDIKSFVYIVNEGWKKKKQSKLSLDFY